MFVKKYNIKNLKIIQKLFSSSDSIKACIYHNKSTNIVFNLAIEEFFYEHNNVSKPILLLYQNDKNVVIGKHQNPWKECNINLMEDEKVNLARRRSGGGAVYQDLGNICFSFLLPHNPLIDFKKINTEIIINAFKKLNVDVEFSGRNDLHVDGKKISGSAFKINLGNKKFGPKALHHGTLLLDVNMDNMMRYLNPNKLKLISKGVDSVKSRVMNLKQKYSYLSRDIIYDSIEREFLSFHGVDPDDKAQYHKSEIEDETKNENPKIRELFNYYNSWEWKFGESPEFTNSLQYKFPWGLVDLCLRAEKGIIKESTIFSDCLNTDFIEKINEQLRNVEGKFNYNKEGLIQLFDTLMESDPEIKSSLEFRSYIEDMKKSLVDQV